MWALSFTGEVLRALVGEFPMERFGLLSRSTGASVAMRMRLRGDDGGYRRSIDFERGSGEDSLE